MARQGHDPPELDRFIQQDEVFSLGTPFSLQDQFNLDSDFNLDEELSNQNNQVLGVNNDAEDPEQGDFDYPTDDWPESADEGLNPYLYGYHPDDEGYNPEDALSNFDEEFNLNDQVFNQDIEAFNQELEVSNPDNEISNLDDEKSDLDEAFAEEPFSIRQSLQAVLTAYNARVSTEIRANPPPWSSMYNFEPPWRRLRPPSPDRVAEFLENLDLDDPNLANLKLPGENDVVYPDPAEEEDSAEDEDEVTTELVTPDQGLQAWLVRQQLIAGVQISDLQPMRGPGSQQKQVTPQGILTRQRIPSLMSVSRYGVFPYAIQPASFNGYIAPLPRRRIDDELQDEYKAHPQPILNSDCIAPPIPLNVQRLLPTCGWLPPPNTPHPEYLRSPRPSLEESHQELCSLLDELERLHGAPLLRPSPPTYLETLLSRLRSPDDPDSEEEQEMQDPSVQVSNEDPQNFYTQVSNESPKSPYNHVYDESGDMPLQMTYVEDADDSPDFDFEYEIDSDDQAFGLDGSCDSSPVTPRAKENLTGNTQHSSIPNTPKSTVPAPHKSHGSLFIHSGNKGSKNEDTITTQGHETLPISTADNGSQNEAIAAKMALSTCRKQDDNQQGTSVISEPPNDPQEGQIHQMSENPERSPCTRVGESSVTLTIHTFSTPANHALQPSKGAPIKQPPASGLHDLSASDQIEARQLLVALPPTPEVTAVQQEVSALDQGSSVGSSEPRSCKYSTSKPERSDVLERFLASLPEPQTVLPVEDLPRRDSQPVKKEIDPFLTPQPESLTTEEMEIERLRFLSLSPCYHLSLRAAARKNSKAKFSLGKALESQPDLMFEIIDILLIDVNATIESLANVNKAYRVLVFKHMSTAAKRTESAFSPVTRAFPYMWNQCMSWTLLTGFGTSSDLHGVKLHTFYVPRPVWIKRIHKHSKTAIGIFKLISTPDFPWPQRTVQVILKMGTLMQYPDNPMRLWMVRHKDLWPDKDIRLACDFMGYVAEIFGDMHPSYDEGLLLRLVLATRSMASLKKFLCGEGPKTHQEVLSLMAYYQGGEGDDQSDQSAHGIDSKWVGYLREEKRISCRPWPFEDLRVALAAAIGDVGSH
ncbi:hypothetical protein NUU61_002024 [Penicillium alfredii]|uniref:Uncharacterized protein n=1 Tax=Penicillium alfredii TaxID=1506179 RepID=A0A9W9FRE3_9EURO|nr:uncharacterized protein NUU61_002024 [Penicillium alfredii]KAJ5104677.1 hypothetical protein NUU61_002024 [Penicillium alfredii]